VILSHAENQPTPLQPPGETIWASDLSPDGSEVLALPFLREPIGITREPRILVIDAATGERSVVVRVGPRRVSGFAWAPDGRSLVVDIVGFKPLFRLAQPAGDRYWFRPTETGPSGPASTGQ
jgi:hypothetical protein